MRWIRLLFFNNLEYLIRVRLTYHNKQYKYLLHKFYLTFENISDAFWYRENKGYTFDDIDIEIVKANNNELLADKLYDVCRKYKFIQTPEDDCYEWYEKGYPTQQTFEWNKKLSDKELETEEIIDDWDK